MAFDLTQTAYETSLKSNLTPQLVIEIDGVSTVYGILPIKKVVKIGEFTIGEAGIVIGGQVLITNQETLISFSAGTSNDISQTLNVDKGTNESVSSMTVALIDKNSTVTQLITPGEIVTDILGRDCKIWLAPDESVNWKDDYIIIFRGFIDDIQSKAGVVLLNLASPDKKKQSAVFPKGSTDLTASMTDSDTTAVVTSTSTFLSPYTGPSGSIDTDLTLYIRIDDEVMKYESTTSTTFGTLTRAQLGTTAAAHSSGANVDSFYVLDGNAIDLALKFLLSGKSDYYSTGLSLTNFNRIDASTLVSDAIFIQDLAFLTEYNPIVGDYITTTGASNGANNVSLKQISAITETDDGVYLTISGVTFVEEIGTSATMSIRSQYDVWGDNAGCAMAGYEVDISEHLDIQSKYLSSAQYKFYLKDTIDSGKDFLSEQIYNPLSTFAIPRKAQSSIGIHQGPIPGVDIKILNQTNVLNAADLNIKRSINKNFYNSIIYKYEDDVLNDKFLSGVVTIDGTSLTQIPVGNKSLIIESKGMRTSYSALNLAQQSSNRRLRKYKFGAEYIYGLKVNFKTGFILEVGDSVIVDMGSLKLSDIKTGDRSGNDRLFQIVNKKINIKSGTIMFDLVDTNFSLDVRYALIGPSSKIKTGVSTTEFIIKPSYNTTKYGTNEYKKWEKFIGAFVVIHSSDYSVSDTSYIENISGNTIILTTALSFTPSADYIMELGDYDNQPASVKLVYGFMSDGSNDFGDGGIPYQMS